MSDYRIEVKVKNNNLLRKLEECGYNTVGEFCRRNDKMRWNSLIGELANLKRSPLNSKGEFLPIVHRICDILLCSPEDLFSEVQLTTALESNKRTMQVNEAEMKFILQNSEEVLSLESQVHKERLPKKIDDLLDQLTPRESKVISMRFGLGQYNAPLTLEATAALNDVTRERIRQIEAKALRKLRHPRRAEVIREYVE